MLRSVSDFRYVDFQHVPASRLVGLVTDGGSLVDPLPVRLDCAGQLPFDSASELTEYTNGDLRTIDPLWLLEAVQERESFLLNAAGTIPSGLVTAPKSLSHDLVAVASALRTWAKRWDGGSVTGVFVKEGIESAVSAEWEDVIAVTLQMNADVKDMSTGPGAPSDTSLSEFTSWAPTGEDEDIFSGGLNEVIRMYALRDYLSVPVFLGEEPDDGEDGSTFAWKAVDGWPGEYPPLVLTKDILALYSDLEKTRCAVLPFTTSSLSVSTKTEESHYDVTEYSNITVDHSIISSSTTLEYSGCPTFRDGKHTISPNGSSNSSKQASTQQVTSALSFLDWLGSFADAGSQSGLVFDAESKVRTRREEYQPGACVTEVHTWPTGYQVDYHGEARTSRLMSSIPSTTVDSAREKVVSRAQTGELTMDLTPTTWGVSSERTGTEIESASVIVASVAVDYDCNYGRKYKYGAFKTASTDHPNGYDWLVDAQCKVNVRIKRVECTIRDGHILVVPTLTAQGVPSASGGKEIKVDMNDVSGASPVDGTRMDPPHWMEDGKYEATRKAILGIGPVIVKFKPKTLVGSGV